MSAEAANEAPTVFQNHLNFIEALRGWAALYVILFHLALVPVPALVIPFWLKKFVLAGGAGVTLFFVVSAFTLAFSMRLHEKQAYPLRRFYIRRVFRIVPLFYVWIILSWFRDRFFLERATSWVSIVLGLTFTFNLVVGYQTGLVWASWTIGVEMLFYLIFPLVYRFVNNLQKACSFLLITLAISSVYSYLFPHYVTINPTDLRFTLKISFLHQLPVFAFGLVVFFLFEKFIQRKSISSSWGFLLIAVSIFGYATFLDGRLTFLMDGDYWIALICSFLVLGLAISPISLFVNRFSLFTGKLSYSLYLNHYAFVVALSPIYERIYAVRMPVDIKFVACVLLTLLCLIPVSWLTYNLIEKPGMQLGTNLIKRLAGKPTAPVATVVPEPVKQDSGNQA